MPTSNERKMLRSNEALKELTINSDIGRDSGSYKQKVTLSISTTCSMFETCVLSSKLKLNDVSKTTHMSCVDAVMHNDEMTTSENILVQIEQNKSRFRMLLLINIGSVQD